MLDEFLAHLKLCAPVALRYSRVNRKSAGSENILAADFIGAAPHGRPVSVESEL